MDKLPLSLFYSLTVSTITIFIHILDTNGKQKTKTKQTNAKKIECN